MKFHELKTDPDVFEKSFLGIKNYEIRFNDRNYEKGDFLYLRETKHTGEEMKRDWRWKPETERLRLSERLKEATPLIYTGRSLLVKVQSILKGPIYGLQDNWVIMSTKKVRVVPCEGNIKWHEV